jgi:hypothetical protein
MRFWKWGIPLDHQIRGPKPQIPGILGFEGSSYPGYLIPIRSRVPRPTGLGPFLVLEYTHIP